MSTEELAPHGAEAAEAQAPAALTKEEKTKNAQALLAQMMSQISRQGNQLDYLTRTSITRDQSLEARFDRIGDLFAFLFDHLHITPPPQEPKLIDATVELLTEVPEGEKWDMRSAWSKIPHPVYGHIQSVLETDNGPEPFTNPHPIVGQRLADAFKALQDAGTLEEGRYYFVKLFVSHDRPHPALLPTLEDQAANAAANDDEEIVAPDHHDSAEN